MLQKWSNTMVSMEKILFLIRHIEGSLKKDIDMQFRENDLTFSQTQVLSLIFRNGGSISQKKLQEDLQVSHPTVVGLVQRLEKSGFISCRKDEKDQRNKVISLTKRAEDFHKQMIQHFEDNDKKMQKDFSDEELHELERLLNKLNDNISID